MATFRIFDTHFSRSLNVACGIAADGDVVEVSHSELIEFARKTLDSLGKYSVVVSVYDAPIQTTMRERREGKGAK